MTTYSTFPSTSSYIANGTINFQSGTFFVTLHTSSFVPGSQTTYANLTNELPSLYGYNQGGQAIGPINWKQFGPTTPTILDAPITQWVPTGGGSLSAAYAVIWQLGTFNGITNPLVGYITLNGGSNLTVAPGADFNLNWDNIGFNISSSGGGFGTTVTLTPTSSTASNLITVAQANSAAIQSALNILGAQSGGTLNLVSPNNAPVYLAGTQLITWSTVGNISPVCFTIPSGVTINADRNQQFLKAWTPGTSSSSINSQPVFGTNSQSTTAALTISNVSSFNRFGNGGIGGNNGITFSLDSITSNQVDWTTGTFGWLGTPPRQNSCRLKFLNKIKFEIRNENLYKAFRRL